MLCNCGAKHCLGVIYNVASGENGERLAGRNWERGITYFNYSDTYDLNLDDKKTLDRIFRFWYHLIVNQKTAERENEKIIRAIR